MEEWRGAPGWVPRATTHQVVSSTPKLPDVPLVQGGRSFHRALSGRRVMKNSFASDVCLRLSLRRHECQCGATDHMVVATVSSNPRVRHNAPAHSPVLKYANPSPTKAPHKHRVEVSPCEGITRTLPPLLLAAYPAVSLVAWDRPNCLGSCRLARNSRVQNVCCWFFSEQPGLSAIPWR